MTLLDTAIGYCRRGWAPLPIPHKSKAPTMRDWPNLRITEADAGRYFIARKNADVAGVVRIDLEDPHFWPEIE